jgi:acetyl-CoA carboxylase carboxyl transferase subunit beta
VRTADAQSPWTICDACHQLVYRAQLARSLGICPFCGRYATLSAAERIESLLDPGSADPLTAGATAEDPLEFTDTKPYPDRLCQARERTGLHDAVMSARGSVGGYPVVVAAMDFRFMGGSLGCAAGEHIAAAAEAALRERVPFLVVTASGGARMQEGVLSLMQLAKTTQALVALCRAGILTISVITDPTYGGVAASFATQADVIVAERGAHLGFAGPRVIAQTIRQRLPAGFQTAEFLLGRGLIDAVVPRQELRRTLVRLLAATAPARPAAGPEPPPSGTPRIIRRFDSLPERDPWQVVRLARMIARPTTLDYAGSVLDGFFELHGDRMSGDCPAIVGGVGRLNGRPVMLIGHQKGHCARELKARNYGMPTPAGYRKAGRLMRMAARLRLPVVSLIDTQGAYPGVEAETDGQAWAISESLSLMVSLPVPVVAVVTGEGGSGGALALAIADRVLVLANSVYSVISPEGCAAILWRDARAAPTAARSLCLEPRDLLRHGIADGVIPEPEGGAHQDPAGAADILRQVIGDVLGELAGLDAGRLVRERAARFRAFGRQVPAGSLQGAGQ